jgi:myo-inositol-1(or 4)-monophosphatase
MDKLLLEVCEVARAAGALIERVAASGVQASRKADASPVSRADLEADALLKERLGVLASAAWLSEETADEPGRLGKRLLWVVDPLDGTREYVERLPEYSVAVALVEDGVPILGVVHHPPSGATYAARRGGGAFRDGARIHVAEGETALASRSEVGKGEFAYFTSRWTLRPVGSIQLKLAMVAAGDAAATWSRGPKHEWDVCAGALIVAEAGGIATDAFGGALRYNNPFPKVKGVLAGAPAAHARALAQLTEIGPSARMAEFKDIQVLRGIPS